MSRRLLPLVASLVALAPATALAGDTWSDPFPGVRRLHRVTSTQDINVLRVDLCAPGVSMRATAPSEKRRTVPSFGQLVGAQAAVNGNFYSPSDPNAIDGMCMGDGQLWGGVDHGYTGPAAFGPGMARLVPHEVVAGPEPWMQQIVSGHPTLLSDNVPRDNSGDTTLCPRNPRTALGLSHDKKTLYVAVVDGRAPGRQGMTCNELGAFMQSLGAWDALALDGGGSSAMWLEGTGVVNHPSDGSLRSSVNHLAVNATGSGPAPHCPNQCQPKCDGTVLVSGDCGRGDCAAFGSRCVDDALGARCAFTFCPDQGEQDVCWGGRYVGHCVNGALTSQGDCGVYGAGCVSDGLGTRCVFGACPAQGKVDVCLDKDKIANCDNGALTGTGDCAAFGAGCASDDLGTRCVFFACPPKGEADVCWSETHVGHCSNGALTSQGDCAAYAAFCSTAGAAGAVGGRCVSAFCSPSPDVPPQAKDSCWLEAGKVAHCDANGGITFDDCPAGQQCSNVGPRRCVPALCPATGKQDVCVDGRLLGHCSEGTVVDGEDCGRGGGKCLVASGGAACVPDPVDAGRAELDSGRVSADASKPKADGGGDPMPDDGGQAPGDAGGFDGGAAAAADARGQPVASASGGCGCNASADTSLFGILGLLAMARRRLSGLDR